MKVFFEKEREIRGIIDFAKCTVVDALAALNGRKKLFEFITGYNRTRDGKLIRKTVETIDRFAISRR